MGNIYSNKSIQELKANGSKSRKKKRQNGHWKGLKIKNKARKKSNSHNKRHVHGKNELPYFKKKQPHSNAYC